MSDFSLISALQISKRLDRIEEKFERINTSNGRPDWHEILKTFSPIISAFIVVIGGTYIGYNLTAALEQRKVELSSIEKIIDINAEIQRANDEGVARSLALDLTLFGGDAIPSLLLLLGNDVRARRNAAQTALMHYALYDDETRNAACAGLINLRRLLASSNSDIDTVRKIETETVDKIWNSISCRS